MDSTHFSAVQAQIQRLVRHFNCTCICDVEGRKLLAEILGQPVDVSIQVQRPFYTDYGRKHPLGSPGTAGRQRDVGWASSHLDWG